MKTHTLNQLLNTRTNDPFFNHFFDGFLSGPSFNRKTESNLTFIPNVDLEETENEYRLSFDLPGIDKKDVKIEINDNHLIVSGERKSIRTSENENSTLRERSFGHFKRSFKLPVDVASDKIRAEVKQGVLDIQVPKSETAKPREIEIR